jgi:hypothetical protein
VSDLHDLRAQRRQLEAQAERHERLAATCRAGARELAARIVALEHDRARADGLPVPLP